MRVTSLLRSPTMRDEPNAKSKVREALETRFVSTVDSDRRPRIGQEEDLGLGRKRAEEVAWGEAPDVATCLLQVPDANARTYSRDFKRHEIEFIN